MIPNKLGDLNNHLFAQLERLDDESLDLDQLKIESQRAKAISGIASQVIKNAKVTIDAMKLVSEGHFASEEMPSFLGVGKRILGNKK